MPVTLPALSRRQWIKGSLAALAVPHVISAKEKLATGELWALFSDTHIATDPALEMRGVVMAENLARCANQVLKLSSKPYGVFVNGDCCLKDGQAGDYQTFIDRVNPLREAGLAVHCTLGNHDDRKNFTAAMTSEQDPRPVEGKHVSTVSSATMNWVLLDTLDQVNQVSGQLGATQLGWLDRVLATLPAKPTVVMAHHNPQQPVTESQKHTGMTDSDALFKVLAKHKKVKAFVYGHTHNWSHTQDESTGLHLINLPPVAYLFDATRPNGWVLATATPEKLVFELRALNPNHAEHRQKVEVLWAS